MHIFHYFKRKEGNFLKYKCVRKRIKYIYINCNKHKIKGEIRKKFNSIRYKTYIYIQ